MSLRHSSSNVAPEHVPCRKRVPSGGAGIQRRTEVKNDMRAGLLADSVLAGPLSTLRVPARARTLWWRLPSPFALTQRSIAGLNCSCAIAKGQAGRAESLGPVHVRVRAKDEDCDKNQSATRSCDGSAFSVHSWAQSSLPLERSKQIQTSPWYSGYFPGTSKQERSQMPGIPKRF